MKRILVISLAVLLSVCAASAHVDNVPTKFVYYSDGDVNAFPSDVIVAFEADSESYRITLKGDSMIVIPRQEVDSVSEYAPVYPSFASYKFNNKYNENLPEDAFPVETDVIGCDTLHVVVPATIGKHLTASFSLDALEAVAYVDGKIQQSKRSRLRFDTPVTYTLTYPGHTKWTFEKVADEVWSMPEDYISEVAIVADMLSTNAPSGRGEGVENVVDGNPATFFHSTRSNDPLYTKLPEDSCPYLQVSLPKPLEAIQFYYQSRIDASNRNPYAFNVYASNNGEEWTSVASLDASSGIPHTGAGAEFLSPVIELGGKYSYLRFEMTDCAYKNYLVLSEFKLYDVVKATDEAELISPAKYAYGLEPLGNEVTVQVDFLTDYAVKVPRIDIDIDGGEMVSSKDYYLNAQITIDGNGAFPDFQDSVQIKGRGNSSWSTNPWAKNPYRLKFASSVKPFGLVKGKNWNLIAQAQKESMMSNVMAQKIARMVGTSGANHTIPVDLYINGNYRGSYLFTEKVGLANNSVDLNDESTAVLLELDSYYDEPYRFKSYPYNLPVNIKEPELDEETSMVVADEKLTLIRKQFNAFARDLYDGKDVSNHVDVEMLARFMLVNELALNMEICHPKSTFLYNKDMYDSASPYVFGPVWDFDWAFGYEESRSYFTSSATQSLFGGVSGVGNTFFRALWDNSDVIKRAYYHLWMEFMEHHFEELLTYADDYLQFANSSFLNNMQIWGDGGNYESAVKDIKSWFTERAAYIVPNLQQYDLTHYPTNLLGDVNGDDVLTVADIVNLVNDILGTETDECNEVNADVNEDAELNMLDIMLLLAMLMDADFDYRHFSTLPEANVEIVMDPVELAIDEQTLCKLSIKGEVENYTAIQFDLQLPSAVQLQGVELDDITNSTHSIVVQSTNETCTRFILYSNESEYLDVDNNLVLQLYTPEVLPASECKFLLAQTTLVDMYGEEYALPATRLSFTQTNGMTQLSYGCHVRGGECLEITVLVPQEVRVFDLQGRCVWQQVIEQGTTIIELPAGIYLVDGRKVVIY